MDVLPPFVVAGADRMTAEGLRDLPRAAPIPFRAQDSGDYDEDLVLRPGRAPGRRGLGVHAR